MGERVNVTEDEGIIKIIERDGAGEEFERPHEHTTTLTLTYSVLGEGDAVVGEAFSSASIRIADPALPPALRKAIPTMRKGEIAKVIAKPPHVDAPITYRVHLERFRDDTHVTTDAGITKQVLVSGDGPKIATNDIVKAKIRGTCNGVVFDDRFETPAEIVIDQYTTQSHILDETLCIILRSCRKGESCRAFVASEYAYGEEGKETKGIPPNSHVEYDIEVVDVTPVGEDPEDLTPQQRIDEADKLRVSGNELFLKGDYGDAVSSYSMLLSMLELDFGWPEDLKSDSRKLKTSAGLNIAACQLKLGAYGDVVGICTELLKQDDTLIKAWFRRAQAYEALGDFDKAMEDFRKTAELNPEDATIPKSIANVERKKKEQDQKDRALYKKMFA